MKKVAAVIFAVILCFCAAFSASAQDSVSLILNCEDSCDSNRLFYIDIYAKSEVMLSGAKFSLTFNGDFIDYRKVSSEFGEVRAHSDNSELTLIFANTDGVDIESEQCIASVQFKSLRSGTVSIGISCDELVAQNYDYIGVNTMSGCELQINGNNVTQKSKRLISSKNAQRSAEKSSATFSQSDEQNEFTPSQSFFAKLNGAQGYVVVIAASSAGVAVLLTVAVFFVVKRKAQKKKDDNSSENTLDDKEPETNTDEQVKPKDN